MQANQPTFEHRLKFVIYVGIAADLRMVLML